MGATIPFSPRRRRSDPPPPGPRGQVVPFPAPSRPPLRERLTRGSAIAALVWMGVWFSLLLTLGLAGLGGALGLGAPPEPAERPPGEKLARVSTAR
jgi:hypothetical protein